MSNDDLEREVESEFAKSDLQLGKDLIQEAMAQRSNDDSVKHLLKRLGLHQLVLDRQVRTANGWLLRLSVVMAIGALASIVQLIYAALAYHLR